MLAILCLNHLAFHQSSNDDAARLLAIQEVIALAKQVETACQPRFLTEPPTPVRVVPKLPLVPGWAEVRRKGGYYVNYSTLSGVVTRSGVTVFLKGEPENVDGARIWSEDECVANARRVARLLVPSTFLVGESSVDDVNDATIQIRTKAVLPQDPRFYVRLVDLEIDRRTGLPLQVEREVSWPQIQPSRFLTIRSSEEVVAESLRVHRALPPIGPARVSWSSYVYAVPAFSQLPRNEMTPEQREREARAEAIPMYEWVLLANQGTSEARNRIIWIDARTGRGIAVSDVPLPGTQGTKKPETVPTPGLGRWRLGKASGTFAKAAPASFEGVPTVVTNERGEVLTLRFDRKSGLVRDETGAYRPDAALLRAMRAEKALVPFGKR